MVHRNITIHGRVQGVFFRHHMRLLAEELGIKGFIHNQPEGSIYIEAEGRADIVDDFIEQCRRGSPKSEVEKVEVSEGPLEGFEYFEVR
ncbi:MAG: acylphosphatase [Patescibacteria group bacterium]